MSLLVFCLGIILEIVAGAAYCIVLGTFTMVAICIIAPLAIVAEIFLWCADLFRPATPPRI